MSQEFRPVSIDDVNERLRLVVQEQLQDVIRTRHEGHCMRVGDLDTPLMVDVGRKLRETVGASAQVHVLSDQATIGDPLFITSSKLVELRNPQADGGQRPPLLVFVPNELRTSAEDSFAEATFEQVSVTTAFPALLRRLVEQLPNGFRTVVSEIVRFVTERQWRWADEVALVRFVLSAHVNGVEPEIIGASLCEMALVPDFHLVDDVAAMPQRLIKNLECVDELTFSTKSERLRVLDLKLKDRSFRFKLGEFLSETGLEDPTVWTRRIVAERQLWPLSFDKWQFEDGSGFAQQLRVEVMEVSLPVIQESETEPRLRQLIGQQVLLIGKNGPRSFKVKFRSDPPPDNIAGLHHFRLQVVARESGPTAFTKKKTAWKGARNDASVSFTNLSKVDWEDGWHFIRVLPCTAEGDPIPMVNAQGQPIPMVGDLEDGQSLHESDLFYVVKADDVEVEVPQRAVPKFASFDHALVHFWFRAAAEGRDASEVVCTHRAWVDGDGHKGKGELLEIKFAGEGLAHVPVSRLLTELERRILGAPEEFPVWHLCISSAQSAEAVRDSSEWPSLPEIDEFRSTRRQLFDRIRGEDGSQIVECADLYPLRDDIAQLAERYLAVLANGLRLAEVSDPDQQREVFSQVQKLITLDTTLVDIADHRGGHRVALLIGPTHPLRLLWLAAWLTLARYWLDQARKGPHEFFTSTRDALLERLSLVNFPAVLPLGSGQLLSTIDSLHPFWTVYGSSGEGDPRGLVAELCTALGVPEPNIGSFTLNGGFLANRVRRYLVQHPYVHTLVLNCFNAGRGKLLADMLLELQREPDFRDLRYNLRLFVNDPDAPGAGEDLNELISPSSTLTVAEADAFATPTGNHLAPKLTFAVRDIADFRTNASEFPAHVSLLFDVFPAQSISASVPRVEDESAPVHGLLQDFTISYVEDADLVAWHRRPRHGHAEPIPDATEFSTILARLAEVMSAAAACVATNQSGVALRPVSTLVLGADQKALLHQVHDVSDWVFTIDKSLGIEFFDHHPGRRRPEYLIDHTPDLSANSGRRVVITSRSQTEIRVLFERVLEDYSLKEFQDRAQALLGELRSLSGRLALKLASSVTHRAEALGLALAKLFLEYQDAFRDQAVVPLDAHLDLFRALQKSADQIEDEITLRRTDLALFDFNSETRVLTCSLVEVKCYHMVGHLGGLNQLKNSIAEQIQQSERTIRHHFDPSKAGRVDRPDRVMKTQEFVTLLEFYVDRANRLNLLSFDAYQEAKFFLRTMERGYTLRFTRSALVFDFDKEGSEEFVEENGIEFHRIGLDVIRKLLTALPATPSDIETRPAAWEPTSVDKIPTETATLQLLVGQVRKLDRAAFLPPKRTRTASWEKLAATSDALSESGEPDLPRTPTVPKTARLQVISHTKTPAPPARQEGSDTGDAPPDESIVPDIGSPAAEPAKHEAGGPAERPDSPVPVKQPAKFAGSPPVYDVALGVTESTPQFGILGKVMGRKIALDLNQTHTISLFGVQGGGKSYTLGSIIEMATLAIGGINQLPQPLATVVFHYSQTQDYKPEFTSMNRPNDERRAIDGLARDFQAEPGALRDIVLLVPTGKLEARRREYPDLEVLPLKFASSELQAGHWRFLMGAVGNQATYIRKLNQIMRSLRDELTLSGLRAAIETAGLPDNLSELAHLRLNLAADYIDDSARLRDVIRPGRLVIVDLRDEFIDKNEALGLFVVLLQLFGDASFDGRPFNKLVVFDEAHKYIGNPDLVEGLVSVVREMRHKGTSILVASQDPPSVPVSLIELSSQTILHRFNSPAWLKHIQKANAALLGLTAEQLAKLNPGEAYIWSSKATDQAFSREAIKVTLRPRVTLHGGSTRTAV